MYAYSTVRRFEVSVFFYAYQDNIYLIQNTVKPVMLWNITRMLNIFSILIQF